MEPPQGRRRRRRGSKDMPPDMSELMKNLIKHSDSFIQGFRSSENRMRAMVTKMKGVVKEMQRKTDKVRTTGTVVGGVGVAAVWIILALATVGVGSLLAAGAAVAVGGAVVVGAKLSKRIIEKGSAKAVEELGTEFMKLVEPLKETLEDILMTCEKLEEESSEGQAEQTLEGMEEFQRTLRRVAELRAETEQVLDVAVDLKQMIGDLPRLIVSFFRVTAAPEEDQKLTDAIIKSADQVVVTFDEMKQRLMDLKSRG